MGVVMHQMLSLYNELIIREFNLSIKTFFILMDSSLNVIMYTLLSFPKCLSRKILRKYRLITNVTSVLQIINCKKT
jgi:hypothetical protein